MASLEQVKLIFSEQLCLGFSEAEQLKAASIAVQYNDPAVHDRVFLNSLCLDVILPAIKDIFDIPQRALNLEKIKQQNQDIWQSLNGVAIDLPEFRLVLIPTENFDTEELRVQQSLVDRQNLVGDFYLAVQVSLEEGWLRVWGFTSHKELKAQGSYYLSDGSYAIDRSDLWMTLEVIPALISQGLPLRGVIPPEPSLQPVPREKIISRFWQPWDELIASLTMNPVMLRQSRLQQWGRKINFGLDINKHSLAIEIGFREEENHNYFVRVRLHPANGQIYLPENLELSILEANGELFKKVTSRKEKPDNWIQIELRGKLEEEFQVKVQLGEVSIKETIVISEFMASAFVSEPCVKIPVFSDDWISGENIIQKLGVDLCITRSTDFKSDLENPETIWGRPIQVLGHELALVMLLPPEGSDRTDARFIKLRLYPRNNQPYLPTGIKLLCREPNEQVYIEKTATVDMSYLEVAFYCPLGKEFITEVQLGDSFTERFAS